MCRELTKYTGVLLETHPCHTLESRAVHLDGSGSGIGETVSKGQTLEVRAALDEIGVSTINDHLTDIRKYGVFAFECHRNTGPVADGQQFQPSEVWQLEQGVNKLLHQVCWGGFKHQVHRQNPGGGTPSSLCYFLVKETMIRTVHRRRQPGSRAGTRTGRTGHMRCLREGNWISHILPHLSKGQEGERRAIDGRSLSDFE